MRKLGQAQRFISLFHTMWIFTALLFMGAVIAEPKPKRSKKTKTTVVHLLLDMTGSMAGRKTETIAAFNEYITSLQASKETTGFSFTFSTFNSDIGVNKVVDQVAMKDVPMLTATTYLPAAVTPLYDAIGRTIRDAENQANKNDGVLIVIQTDGYENASQEYTEEAVKLLIEEHAAKGWQFVYLGCDLDAMGQGAAIGIQGANTISYDNASVQGAYRTLSTQTISYATGGSQGSAAFMGDDPVDLRTAPLPTVQLAQVQPEKSKKPSTWSDA